MDPKKPVRAAKKAAATVAEKAAEMIEKPIPGVPASEPPALEEPTTPREPAAAQAGPGRARDAHADRRRDRGGAGRPRGQQGAYLTTAQGARLRDTDHSLKAGPRGPDPAAGPPPAREDHATSTTSASRSGWCTPAAPARTACSRAYGTADAVTQAGVPAAEDVETPVFVRFSTVLGSRGSADTVRDTRGFATKFYTDEGTFDLVGNNIPVFFIQDGIKFPDVIHAGKPHPDREIPQAQSAHDTFWDFVSLHTEAQHHTMWNMSDRGHPALVPDDGGLRRPHLPAGQRRRRDLAGEVPLEAAARACTR